MKRVMYYRSHKRSIINDEFHLIPVLLSILKNDKRKNLPEIQHNILFFCIFARKIYIVDSEKLLSNEKISFPIFSIYFTWVFCPLEAEQKVIRNEMNAKFEGIDKKFSSKFESQQQQINDLKQFFFWGFGIVIALIIALFGYIIWDRRTAIYPLLNRVNSLENNQDEFGRKLVEVDRIKSALKEMGESDAKIAEILKRVAIF